MELTMILLTEHIVGQENQNSRIEVDEFNTPDPKLVPTHNHKKPDGKQVAFFLCGKGPLASYFTPA
jgi:hypothetical protein